MKQDNSRLPDGTPVSLGLEILNPIDITKKIRFSFDPHYPISALSNNPLDSVKKGGNGIKEMMGHNDYKHQKQSEQAIPKPVNDEKEVRRALNDILNRVESESVANDVLDKIINDTNLHPGKRGRVKGIGKIKKERMDVVNSVLDENNVPEDLKKITKQMIAGEKKRITRKRKNTEP